MGQFGLGAMVKRRLAFADLVVIERDDERRKQTCAATFLRYREVLRCQIQRERCGGMGPE